MKQDLKAYSVLETEEHTGGIVFAKSNVEARRKGAAEFNHGEFSGLTVHREKSLDNFSETGVSAAVLIEMGWHFECWGCGSRLDAYWLEENHMNVGQVLGKANGPVYCCWTCKAEAASAAAAKEAYGEVFLETMKREVTRRFGPVQFRSDIFKEYACVKAENGQMHITQAAVSFDFPGMKIAPASAHYDLDYSGKYGPAELVYRCCYGDKQAFEGWAKETKEKEH